MSAAIAVRALTAGYGDLEVVHGLDLEVERGEVVALLGPNGAGKTTTLLTIAGVLPPLSGTIEVLGRSTRGESVHALARRGLGFVPEGRDLFLQLTTAENLRLARRPHSDVRIDDVLAHFPALLPRMKRRAGSLSGGEQQMLAIAVALVSQPQALMVDEMSMGLAPIVVEQLAPVIRRLADEENLAILLVEQHIEVALELADRAYVLRHGDLVHTGSSDEIATLDELIEESYLGRSPGPISAKQRTGLGT